MPYPLQTCNIEVLQGHKVGCFTEQGDSSCDYLAAGTKTVGVYLYETACGTFTAVGVTGALLLMEADKVRILAI